MEQTQAAQSGPNLEDQVLAQVMEASRQDADNNAMMQYAMEQTMYEELDEDAEL